MISLTTDEHYALERVEAGTFDHDLDGVWRSEHGQDNAEPADTPIEGSFST